MPDTDNTTLISRRQLIQSVGQFTAIFLTGMLSHMGVNWDLTWRNVATCAVTAVLGSLSVLGISYIPTGGGK